MSNEKKTSFVVTDETSFDPKTELTWTKDDAVDRDIRYSEANPIADEFNANAFAGFTDWRVPTIDELETIRDRSKFNPAIDTDAFPTCKSCFYWSCTEDAEEPSDCVWGVYFYYGHSYILNRYDRFLLRLVRGPSRQ